MRDRGLLLGLSLLMAACGGEAERGSLAVGGAASSVGGAPSSAGGVAASRGGESTETGGDFTELTSTFDTAQPLQNVGLWMGLGEELPIGEPPAAYDGTALHLVGDSGTGLDVFFHTPLPVERIAREVKFSAYSSQAMALTVGIAGAEPTYFSDHAADTPWPERAFGVGAKWRSFSFSLDGLSPAPPHEEMFGAVHLVVQPGVHYDFWIDDFTLVSR